MRTSSHLMANYVKKYALVAIVFATLGIWLLKAVFDYLAQLEKLSDSYTVVDALQYILYTAPQALHDYMGVSALLGGVIGLGMLANHSELVVMQAAGISRFQIVKWVMQPAALFVVMALALNQFVLPTTNHLARQIKQESPLLASAIHGYWQKQDHQIISIEYADANGQLKNIKRWQLGERGEIVAVSTAKTGTFIASQASAVTPDKPVSQWQLQDIRQIRLAADGTSELTTAPTQTVSLPIEPASIYLLTRSPEDMSLTDLWQHREFLQSQKRRSLEHEVAFWKKVLSPFAILSLVLVACSFVFGSLRSQSLGFRIVTALLFGLVFSYIQDLVGFISLSTGISPMLMVALPIVASAILGTYLIRRKT